MQTLGSDPSTSGTRHQCHLDTYMGYSGATASGHSEKQPFRVHNRPGWVLSIRGLGDIVVVVSEHGSG